MDICGYFMSIKRDTLLDIANNTLIKMRFHRVNRQEIKTWDDVVDFDFILYLTKEIITLDPTKNCIFRSEKEEWDDLPKSKSLFHTGDGCGLPIGNLTSQLFSNVYLNEFDQFVKRTLKCKHYGRYVDDAYIVSKDKEFLKSIINPINKFFNESLQLKLHLGKTQIYKVNQGVEFLGAFIKPYRTYVSNPCLRRMNVRITPLKTKQLTESPLPSINSYLGILKHYSSFNIRKHIFVNISSLYKYGFFNNDVTKFIQKDPED